MSLDVYLEDAEEVVGCCPHCGGSTVVRRVEGEVFSRNITHNLNRMAEAAGIYMHLWRPEEIGVTKASQLISALQAGLAALEADPDRFRQLEPENKWGTYDGFVRFVYSYLAACRSYPDAMVRASR